MRDLRIPLETLWAARRPNCASARRAAARRCPLRAAQRFLLCRLDRGQQPHPAVRHASICLATVAGSASIGGLADECGLTAPLY